MRELCANLTEAVVDSGHWMAQEKPVDVNHASDVVRLQGDVRMTRILEIRNTVVPIASDIRNAFIDFPR